ncbi:MAG: ImmA/IrrE family metallo-endopeptidase [Alphaproteobacteria bacterium]|nr:ImmA/IrrE family metallo-endopeptidase [Alphaproteobacteria bacterium]
MSQEQQSLPPPKNIGVFSSNTETILAHYKNIAPVDVVAVARDIGIRVYTSKLGSISGILRRDNKLGGASGFVIFVNEAHHINRQRFTVAHEIGHFMLHRDRAENGIQDDEFYRALSGPLETGANQFAADLLMPWPLVKRLQDSGITGLESLARALAVSKQAMAYRLGLPYDQDWE